MVKRPVGKLVYGVDELEQIKAYGLPSGVHCAAREKENAKSP